MVTSNYPYSLTQLQADEIQQLEGLCALGLQSQETEEQTIEAILGRILPILLKEFRVYFVYWESFPQPKSQIRTFKKMFYGQKKALNPHNLLELEVDIEEGKSVLCALVRLDLYNMNYVLKHLNSNFAFGFMVEKSKRSFAKNRISFLQNLETARLKGANSSKLNLLKVFTQVLNAHKVVLETKTTGADEELVSIFHKADSPHVKHLLAEAALKSQLSLVEQS